MIYNIATLGTVLLSLIVDGYVGEKYGWRRMFDIMTPFTIIGLLLVIFAVPEHTYVREHRKDTNMVANGDDSESGNTREAEKVVEEHASAALPAEPRPIPARKTLWQELRPYNGRLTNINPLVVIARSFVCMLFPTVIFSFLISSMWSAFNASIAVTMAQSFSRSLSPTYLGYISTFPFVGTFIGFVIGQLISDPSAKWAARRNKGVFEPEFRMFMVIPGIIFGIPAYFGYGNYATTENPSWLAISAIFGVFAFGNIFACAAAYNYVLDAHNDIRMDVTVAIVAARNVFWWGSTQFMSEWLEVAPINIVYDASGAILGGVTLLTIFFYMFGKIFRSLIHRYSPFKIWGWD